MKGKGLVITGISGGGKTTIAQAFADKHPHIFQPLRMTIREPRPGEIHGVHYEFVTEKELLQLEKDNELLFCKNWYGSTYAMRRKQVEKRLAQNENVLIETIVPAAFELFRRDDMKVVFLVTPDEESEITRLRNRGEKEEKIQKRVEYARKEKLMAKELGVFTVVNENLEVAISQVEDFLLN